MEGLEMVMEWIRLEGRNPDAFRKDLREQLQSSYVAYQDYIKRRGEEFSEDALFVHITNNLLQALPVLGRRESE